MAAAAAAQDFVQAAGPGAGLDYTPGSLHALDAALEAAHVGALALTPMQTVGAAYLYEVARREHGGLYEVCDDEDPVVLVCGESGAQVCLAAIAKVERRIRYGQAEAIPPLRTLHRGAACRRDPDPALDPRQRCGSPRPLARPAGCAPGPLRRPGRIAWD